MAKALGGIAFALFIHLWWRSGGGEFAGPVFVRLGVGAGVVWDLGLLGFFFVAHSGFASGWFKRRVKLDRLAMRRLYHGLTLPVTLVVWLAWVPLPRPVLWDARGALAWPFAVVRLVALAGLVWTVRSFSLPDFFGDGAGTEGRATRLSVGGAFALCRHPLYLFMMLLAASTTVMPLGRALMAAGLMIYVVVGSRLEERKLEAEFGAAYTRYRAETPWLIPTPRSITRACTRACTRAFTRP